MLQALKRVQPGDGPCQTAVGQTTYCWDMASTISTDTSTNRLYFRQLLAGRDFATHDAIAQQMRNFSYVIGDRQTGEAMVIDPAYATDDLLDILAADGMTLSGVLVSHHHPDHVGGSMLGFTLQGLAELLEKAPVAVHVNSHEAPWVSRVTGIAMTELTTHSHGDTVTVGDIEIELLHTPGHTPGSQCFLLQDRLISGDTVFLEGCGRTDFPGGNSDDMFASLQHLATLPGDPVVFPGHWYSTKPSAALSEVTSSNYVYRASTLQQWHALMG